MTYVIAEPCIRSKAGACIEVCPVDCIHPTPEEPGYAEAEMMFIEPGECIDCGVCAEACPVNAPYADDELPSEWMHYAAASLEYYAAMRAGP
jgi:NAD-dependent dihydropyrimidine dehydrogenase PreA subunit